MKIGIVTLKSGTQAGGIATYESCLIHALAEIDKDNEYHICCVAPVERSHFKIDQPNFHFHEMSPRHRMVNMCWGVPRALRRAKVDFYHVTFLPPLWCGKPYVFTAHGPEMFIDPKFFPFMIRILLLPLIRRCYKGAARIGCVSGDTRSYMVKHYPRTDAISRVVYNGCLETFSPRDPEETRTMLEKRWGIAEPYVLFVGRVEPRKNPIGMLEAYAKFRDETGGSVKLVIAGGLTWSAGEAKETIDRLNLDKDVIRLGHVDHEDLPWLYSGAEMFVFPSLWEGFGLPLIEAMRCGAPTITSDISCLPEVAGGASLLVDPKSPDSIAQAMVRLHESSDTRTTLREKGLVRGQEFSWRRCAEETLAVYEDLAGSANPES